MEIIKNLAVEYSKLASDDKRRTNLLDSVGGGDNAEALDALLSSYGKYEDILLDYARGIASIASAADQAANSWEGSLNRLSATWTDTVGNIMDPDIIIPVINTLNNLVSVINNVTGSLGAIGSISLGAGLFAGLKNVGVAKLD